MIKVAIITTTRHNIGDDFVRDGISFLIRKVLGPIDELLIHKHLPIEVRREALWIRTLGVQRALDKIKPGLALALTQRIDRVLPKFDATDSIANADLLIQSGAPIYWHNSEGSCNNTEWWRPLILDRWAKAESRIPFLNLAGGTCQQWGSDGSEFREDTAVLDHIRKFFDFCTLTTLRDELSRRVLALAGRDAEILPCTSLFAADRLEIRPEPHSYIVLNYMPAGGHFQLGQAIDASKWEKTFRKVATGMASRHRCIMVCHDQRELAAARRLMPDLETFHSNDYREYLRLYSRAQFGLMNRVHGAFALASLGKPSIVVGSDSRAQMAGLIGLESLFVNDATPDWLNEKLEGLENQSGGFREAIRDLKKRAEQRYCALIESACSRLGQP